jgi:hypothetical protein
MQLDWTFAFLFILLVGAVAITQLLTRSVPRRRELKEQLAATPERPPIDIHALVREEVADLGIDRVPGGDGVDLAVLLRVWRRDEAVHGQCAEGIIHFQLRPGTVPDTAEDQDVRLVCVAIDGDAPPWEDPPPEEAALEEAAPEHLEDPPDEASPE